MGPRAKWRWMRAPSAVVFLSLAAAGGVREPEPGGGSARGVSLAPEVVREMGSARQDPRGYARNLRALLGRFKGRILTRPGRIDLRTQEGEPAVREAIAFLERQAPLPGLTFNRSLALAAQDHVADQGPKGQTGHTGSRGQTMGSRVERYGRFQQALGENINYGPWDAREIVVDLIIDDGVSSRGHRQNIFNPAYRVAGAATGPHAVYQYMCVIDFAGGFVAKTDR